VSFPRTALVRCSRRAVVPARLVSLQQFESIYRVESFVLRGSKSLMRAVRTFDGLFGHRPCGTAASIALAFSIALLLPRLLRCSSGTGLVRRESFVTPHNCFHPCGNYPALLCSHDQQEVRLNVLPAEQRLHRPQRTPQSRNPISECLVRLFDVSNCRPPT
jgi:hypothetical protein